MLHTTVVMCGYLHYCHLPVSFDQSGPSPLTSLVNKLYFCPQNCCSLDVFCFSHHSLQTLETVVCENPRRSAVSEIFKPPRLAPTVIPQSKSLRSHFFPILTFGLKNSWTSWPCLHAFMHLVAATLVLPLIKYLHYQAGVQVYLIKCSVCVYLLMQHIRSIDWYFILNFHLPP